MKIYLLIILSIAHFSACATSKEKKTKSITLKKVIEFKDSSLKKATSFFGSPTESAAVSLRGYNYTVQRYRRHSYLKLDIFVAEKSRKIVEKVFYTNNSDQYEFKKITNAYFPKVRFEKTPISCSQHNNLIYYSLNDGIYLTTEGSDIMIIKAIGLTNQNQIEARLQENKTKNCR